MKIVSVVSAIIVAAILLGCATRQRRDVTITGPGTKRVYAATFDQTWRAALNAARRSDLALVTTDHSLGYIEGRRPVYTRYPGEKVGIWVRTFAPAQTEVEVADRQVGPPMLALVDREVQIQNDIAVNLAREYPPVGAAPRDVIIERGSDSSIIVVPEKRETIVVPETAPTREALREEQRRIDEIRLKQEAGARALANEVDQTKREMIQRQIDELRQEMRLQEKRLHDLERELK